jgi:hypothetical protein
VGVRFSFGEVRQRLVGRLVRSSITTLGEAVGIAELHSAGVIVSRWEDA